MLYPAPGQENKEQGFDHHQMVSSYLLLSTALFLIIHFFLPRIQCVALPELQADWGSRIKNRLFLFGTVVVIVRHWLDAYRAVACSTTSL